MILSAFLSVCIIVLPFATPLRPWVLGAVGSPPPSSPVTFASIVEEERQQEAALIRSREKPLALIQVILSVYVSALLLMCGWMYRSCAAASKWKQSGWVSGWSGHSIHPLFYPCLANNNLLNITAWAALLKNVMLPDLFADSHHGWRCCQMPVSALTKPFLSLLWLLSCHYLNAGVIVKLSVSAFFCFTLNWSVALFARSLPDYPSFPTALVDRRAGNSRTPAALQGSWQPRRADRSGEGLQRSDSSPDLEQTLMWTIMDAYMPRKGECPSQLSPRCSYIHPFAVKLTSDSSHPVWEEPGTNLFPQCYIEVWIYCCSTNLFSLCACRITECCSQGSGDFFCMSLFFSLYILVGLCL